MESKLFGFTKAQVKEEKDMPLIRLFGISIYPDEKAPPLKEQIHREINLPSNEPDLSAEFRRDLGARMADEVSLVFSKRLFKSDVNRGLTRLSMPRSQILNRFLSDQEERLLQLTDDSEKPIKLAVEVIDPSHQLRNLTLVRWNYDNSGSTSSGKRKREIRSTSSPGCSYMLSGKWREIVDCNDLKAGNWIQVWAFRKGDGALRFAIVNVDKESPQIRDLNWGRKKKRGTRSRRSADA